MMYEDAKLSNKKAYTLHTHTSKAPLEEYKRNEMKLNLLQHRFKAGCAMGRSMRDSMTLGPL